MKRFLTVLFLTVLSVAAEAQGTKAFSGFDGGMMLHAGYLYARFPQVGDVSGMTFGIGGVARIHFGRHWRVGGEGYVSSLVRPGEGGFIRCGWGGLLCDFYWPLGCFVPYAGLTAGGGANTNLLVTGEKRGDWEVLEGSYYNKRGFFALDPFIGCDYVISESFHLTLKVDWLNCISAESGMPSGPRLYAGFIFFH